MARDWKLDDYGDIDMSVGGDIQWVEDEDEVAQLAETKILKAYDEDYFALDSGIHWFDAEDNAIVMFDHDRDAKYKALVLKAAMLQIPEVTDVVELTMNLDTETGVQAVTVELDTIYSDVPRAVNS